MGDFLSNLSNVPQYAADWWNGKRSINPVSWAWNSLPGNVKDTYTSGARALVDMSTPASVRDYTTSAQDTARSAMQGDGWGTATSGLGMVNAALGAIPIAGMGVRAAQQGARMGGKALGMGVADTAQDIIRGYHGSPHNFPAERKVMMPDGTIQFLKGAPDVLPDVPQGAKVLQDYPLGRFDLSKMGTGEGAQAYGAGGYIAGHEPVAIGYRDNLTSSGREWGQRALNSAGGDIDAAIAATQGKIDRYRAGGNESYAKSQEDILRSLQHYKQNGDFSKGHMYEVAIHADPAKMLDIEKPLGQQTPYVRSAVEQTKGMLPPNALDDLGGDLSLLYGKQIYPNEFLSTMQAIGGRPDAGEQMLRQAGVPGAHYLDAGSRGAGDGSRNFVVFDDSIIEILRKYGLLPAAGAAGFYGATAGDPQPQGAY